MFKFLEMWTKSGTENASAEWKKANTSSEHSIKIHWMHCTDNVVIGDNTKLQ